MILKDVLAEMAILDCFCEQVFGRDGLWSTLTRLDSTTATRNVDVLKVETDMSNSNI